MNIPRCPLATKLTIEAETLRVMPQDPAPLGLNY